MARKTKNLGSESNTGVNVRTPKNLIKTFPAFKSDRNLTIYMMMALPGILERFLEENKDLSQKLVLISEKIMTRYAQSALQTDFDIRGTFLNAELKQSGVNVDSLSLGVRVCSAMSVFTFCNEGSFSIPGLDKIQKKTPNILVHLPESIADNYRYRKVRGEKESADQHGKRMLRPGVMSVFFSELVALYQEVIKTEIGTKRVRALLNHLMETSPIPEPSLAGLRLKARLSSYCDTQSEKPEAIERILQLDPLGLMFIDLYCLPDRQATKSIVVKTNDAWYSTPPFSNFRNPGTGLIISSETFSHLLNESLNALAGGFTRSEIRHVLTILSEKRVMDNGFTGDSVVALLEIYKHEYKVSSALIDKVTNMSQLEKCALEMVGLWIKDAEDEKAQTELLTHWIKFFTVK